MKANYKYDGPDGCFILGVLLIVVVGCLLIIGLFGLVWLVYAAADFLSAYAESLRK